jgi:hypothetical protein
MKDEGFKKKELKRGAGIKRIPCNPFAICQMGSFVAVNA